MRTFNAYVQPIFLYNCETWTLTVTKEKSIDCFHRRILRKNVLDVKWPQIMTNDQVYEKTKVQPSSLIIRKRRLRWLGHVVRLPNETPVKKALNYAMQTYKRCKGRPQTTWINMMTKQIKDELNLTWEEISIKAMNREEWRTLIG